MLTIKKLTENQIIINKSKFITSIFRVDNANNIESYLHYIKDKYKNATHYCYAYIIDNYERYNDDGEPSGTAGKPILDVLKKNNLNHVLCVVTRYFGGILLGAGGLVRAYSKSASECIKLSKLTTIEKGKNIIITFNYSIENKIDSIIKKENILYKHYSENITYNINVTEEQLEKISSFNIVGIEILCDIYIDS